MDRNENMTLADMQHKGLELSPAQVEGLFDLLKGRTHARTRSVLRDRLELPLQYWRFESYLRRIRVDAAGCADYCAGQDYPAEIARIRNALIKG